MLGFLADRLLAGGGVGLLGPSLSSTESLLLLLGFGSPPPAPCIIGGPRGGHRPSPPSPDGPGGISLRGTHFPLSGLPVSDADEDSGADSAVGFLAILADPSSRDGADVDRAISLICP